MKMNSFDDIFRLGFQFLEAFAAAP